MTIETLRKESEARQDEAIKLGLYVSYRQVLESMYETASQRKNYVKASLINDLIIEDTNN